MEGLWITFFIIATGLLGYSLYEHPFGTIKNEIYNQTSVLRDIHTELTRMNDLTEKYHEEKEMEFPEIDHGFTPWRNMPVSYVTDALVNPLSKGDYT